jgi:hypothetical protein
VLHLLRSRPDEIGLPSAERAVTIERAESSI